MADATDMVELGTRPLSIDEVVRVARGDARLVLTDEASRVVRASHAALRERIERGEPIYGVTTGVGALDGAGVSAEDNRAFQLDLLRTHAASVGPPMRGLEVRAMMTTRAAVLARGMSGVRPETLAALLALVERGVTPVVPSVGSVGASDLAPLACMARVLAGEGRARVGGETLDATEALARAGLVPAELGDRDALALINGLDQTLALAVLAVHAAAPLVRLAEAAASMTAAATRSSTAFLDPRAAAAKGHAGVIESSRRMRASLAGVPPSATLRAPLSIRYAPQVAGAAREALAFCTRIVETELGATVDNPLIAPDGWSTNDAGATSGQQIAEALHLLATSLASVGVTAERRTARLLEPDAAVGRPAFLVDPNARPAGGSGAMIAQYTAAALVAELRTRSAPASLQSIPTSAGTEDQVSMSALAARHAAWVLDTVQTLLAIELLSVSRAFDLSSVEVPPALRALHDAVRIRLGSAPPARSNR